MKHSEFYEAVEATFGSALGRSYVSDLYLASLGATARDALSAGVNPDEVWATLCEETGREDARWIATTLRRVSSTGVTCAGRR